MDRTTRRINKNLSEIQALFVVGGVSRYRSIVDCRSLVVEKIPKLAERETKRISIQLYATIVLHAVISYSTIKHPTYSTSRTLNGISQAGQAAMVRPVSPKNRHPQKNGVAWIVTYACVIEWPLQAGHCNLGRLNYGEVFFELFRVFKHSK